MSNLKVPTRQEYYASQGFSGSAIDRPDDPIDDAFVQHCEGLKAFANGFIAHCKSANSSKPFIGSIENKQIELTPDETVNTAVKLSEDIKTGLKELNTLYAILYGVVDENVVATTNIVSNLDFADKAFNLFKSHTALLEILLKQSYELQHKLDAIEQSIHAIKLQHDYSTLISSIEKILGTKT